MARSRRILPLIVISQFAGTSLWFAGNAILSDLQKSLNLPGDTLGWITNAVQFGFIIGTLVFAYFSFADRYSPTKIFLLCSFLGAVFNLGMIISSNLFQLLSFRFLTGFFLAGIYPVGMKIAASWYKEGLGKALGWLVGALVFGTAFPHWIKGSNFSPDWQTVVISVSIISALGGLLVYFFVPDGPYTGKATSFQPSALKEVFKSKYFRSAAFGYFGHMWELYTFWAFVPIIILKYGETNGSHFQSSLLSFSVIGIGGIGCILGGLLSLRKGNAPVAFLMLTVSGICCLLSVFILQMPAWVFILFLLIWGFAVVGDSPQFSTLTAKTAPNEYVGTGLTIVNSIGFTITIVSISILNSINTFLAFPYWFWVLLPGPVFGLFSLYPSLVKKR